MRRLALAMMLIGCGGTAQEQSRSAQLAAPLYTNCETIVDAGTPCDPCPGAVASKQTDYPQGPDGGTVLTFRECTCPAGSKAMGIIWRACPPVPTGYAGYPATTCAEVAKEFSAACGP